MWPIAKRSLDGSIRDQDVFDRALTGDDFTRILTEPQASLTEQYTALMATEGVKLKFTSDGVERIAEIAWKVNESTENIGARRLHTVMERLLDVISYEAPDKSGTSIAIDATYADNGLGDLLENEDLRRTIRAAQETLERNMS